MTTESIEQKIRPVNLTDRNPTKLTIRSYEGGDENQILDLWQEVFQGKRSLEHWYWKFKNNPYLKVQAALACTTLDKKIVSHYTVIPVKMNFNGASVLAGQVVDLITHPDFWRQGLSLKTAQHCNEELQQNNVSIIFSFFSKTSYPGHVKRLEYKPIKPLRQYWLRLNFSNRVLTGVLNICYCLWLRSKLFIERFLLKHWSNNMTFRLSSTIAFHQSKTVPEGYDQLWDAIRPYDVLSLWKDSEYFQWRYDENPDNDFDYFYLLQGGEIIAISVVTSNTDGDVSICEFLVKDKNVLNGRFLINKILTNYSGRQHQKMRFIGSDVGFFDEVFVKFRSEIWFGIVFCARVFGNTALKEDFDQPSYWTLTYGDIDLV